MTKTWSVVRHMHEVAFHNKVFRIALIRRMVTNNPFIVFDLSHTGKSSLSVVNRHNRSGDISHTINQWLTNLKSIEKGLGTGQNVGFSR